MTAGNFIREKNKTFSITLLVKRACAEITSLKRAADKELDDIEQLIGAAAATDEQPNLNDLKYVGFLQKELRAAVGKYLSARI